MKRRKTELYKNTEYGQILLRDNYEDALLESEEMYDKECERKGCPTPKEERTTKYLIGVKENVLGGQVGLHLPPNTEVPSEYVRGVHRDNPYWVNYEFLNGDPFMAIGLPPFGVGLVNPSENRKILEGNFAPDLIKQVRKSARKYTIQVHNRCSQLINDLLKKPEIKEQLLQRIDSDLFEELVADLLRERGFDVFLTSRTGDGGKDIWATIVQDGKPITALVECKVRNSKRAIDPLFARAVVGTFYLETRSGDKCRFRHYGYI